MYAEYQQNCQAAQNVQHGNIFRGAVHQVLRCAAKQLDYTGQPPMDTLLDGLSHVHGSSIFFYS